MHPETVFDHPLYQVVAQLEAELHAVKEDPAALREANDAYQKARKRWLLAVAHMPGSAWPCGVKPSGDRHRSR